MIKHSFSPRYSLIIIFALVFPLRLFSQTVLNVPNGLNGIGSIVTGNNVGIGTTSPNTKLHIFNNVMDAPALILQGSTIDPDVSALHYVGLRFDGDYGNATGNYSEIRSYSNLYSYYGSYLTFHTMASNETHPLVERMRISQNGNVGIGTTSPRSALEVNGNIRLPATGGKIIFGFGPSGSEDDYLLLQDAGSPDPLFKIQQDGQTKFSITGQNGNVGIGTTTPEYKLDVKGVIKSDNDIISSNGTISSMFTYSTSYNGGVVGTQTNHPFFIYTSSTPKVTVDPTGKVGIGTTAPTQALQIDGASTQNVSLYIHNANGNNRAFFSSYPDKVAIESDNDIVFKTSYGGWSDKFTFTKDGKFGIGTTTPGDYRLNVSGKIRADEIVVNTSGADFVFDPEYNLPDLAEVEKYIEENKHLPDIGPASEMQSDGMNVSEMQTKLLQKIEELTLYIIEQDKRIQDLEQKLNQPEL